jgi:hypothetical protein
MKKAVFAVVAMQAVAAVAQTSEVYVVQVTDQEQKTTFHALSLQDYQARRDEMAARNRNLPKALDQAKAEWKAQNAPASKAFPPGVAMAGVVKSVAMFSSREKAEAKAGELTRVEEARTSHGDKSSGLEKQIEQLKTQIKNLRGNNVLNNQQRDTALRSSEVLLDMLEAKLAKRQADEAAMAADLTAARALYAAKLEALLTRTQ